MCVSMLVSNFTDDIHLPAKYDTLDENFIPKS